MKKVLLFLLIATGHEMVFAQDIDQEALLRRRDSLENLLMVNPGASAILVRRGEVELYSFNSLMSTSQFNDKQGNNANLPGKYLNFFSLIQANLGVSRNRRLNVGLDVSYKVTRYTSEKDDPIFSVFEGGPETVRSFAYAGPRIRWQPFAKVSNFTYQSHFWFPIAKETRQDDLGTSRMNWGHTFFYYKYFSRKIGVFAQAAFTFAFPTSASGENATTEYYMPLSASLVYVPTPKNILYGTLTYSWTNYDISKLTEGADSDFSQYGIGYQRVISKYFFANISYYGTLFARNYGVWNNVSIGVRFVF